MFIKGFFIGIIFCGVVTIWVYKLEKKQARVFQLPIILRNINNVAGWLIRSPIIGWFLVVFFPLIFVIWIEFRLDPQSAILLFTFWAILVYTWKTWQLKDLTSKQIELSVQPIVIFEVDQGFYVRNVGNGMARDIEINIPSITYPDGNNGQTVCLDFPTIGVLPAKQNDSSEGKKSVGVTFKNSNNQEIVQTQARDWLFSQYNTIDGFEVTLEYKDINGTKHSTFMASKEKEFKLISIS